MAKTQNPAVQGGAGSNLRFAVVNQTVSEDFYIKSRSAFQGVTLSTEALRNALIAKTSSVVVDLQAWRMTNAR